MALPEVGDKPTAYFASQTAEVLISLATWFMRGTPWDERKLQAPHTAWISAESLSI